jgi:hypothetical protein
MERRSIYSNQLIQQNMEYVGLINNAYSSIHHWVENGVVGRLRFFN